MKKLLKERNIEYLLHFTKYSNFPSIMENGLVRRSELDRRNIPYEFNDRMRLDGHPNSLSLSIGFPNYRMFYPARRTYPEDLWVVLVLSTDVLIDKRCSFYPSNAATACYKNVPPRRLQGVEAFGALFTDQEGIERASLEIPDDCTTDPQAEVLVFDDIESQYVLGVATENTQQAKEISKMYKQFDDDCVGMCGPFFDARKDYKHWQ